MVPRMGHAGTRHKRGDGEKPPEKPGPRPRSKRPSTPLHKLAEIIGARYVREQATARNTVPGRCIRMLHFAQRAEATRTLTLCQDGSEGI